MLADADVAVYLGASDTELEDSADVGLGASVDASADVGGSGASAKAPADVGGSVAPVDASASSEKCCGASDEVAPEDVCEDTLLNHVVTPMEGKMAQAQLSKINAADAPLYAALLHNVAEASKSSLKRGASSSSSSDPMQQSEKKVLKAHLSISSDDTPMPKKINDKTTSCDYPCLPCAMAGVPPILDCCLPHGTHGGFHLCILCMSGEEQGESSSAVTGLPLPVVDTQSDTQAFVADSQAETQF